VRIECRSTAVDAACPRCGAVSSRVHGWCERSLADVPVGGRKVLLVLRVRRMLCVSAQCSQRTFMNRQPNASH